MRNVLITPDEVLFHISSQHTLDIRQIESSIIIAEERFIRPELGYKLYTELITAKNVEVTSLNVASLKITSKIADLEEGDLLNAYEQMSADQKKLWKEQLWKLTAECVLATAFPEAFVQFTTQGVFHNSPPAGLMVTSGQVTPLLSSMKWSLDKKIQDRISPLIQSLHNYLCLNKTSFALYDSKNCPDCEGQEIKNAKFTGIALNIYDDEEDENCCGSGWWK